jgi:hypothetical protein
VVDGADLLRIGRRIDGREIVFLANPSPQPAAATVRAEQPLVAWDPVTLRRRALPPSSDGGYALELPPVGSVVLVPGSPADEPATDVVADLALDGDWRLTLPGVGESALPGGPRPWTDLGPAAAGFAGVGTYATEVRLGAAALRGRSVVLAAADVGDLAAVRVNGVDCGVAWTHPFELDVTAAIRPGRNTVEVDVANAWTNRLIAEAASPTGEVFAPVAAVYRPDAPRVPSGLSGPVRLLVRG